MLQLALRKWLPVYGSKFSELKIPYNTVVMVNFVDLKCEASEKRWSGSYKGERYDVGGRKKTDGRKCHL